MPTIRQLQLQQVRTHGAFLLDISPQVTLITGKNGSGKTTLLEALYIALQGSSFKSSDSDVLQYEMPWWRIDVRFDDDSTRVVKYDPSKTTGKKQFIIDQKTAYRLTPRYKYTVVLFEPDDLRLLHGSPTRRRQFIDRFISQLEPLYATTMRKYERALKQRNNLLKCDVVTADDLFVWNVALSEYGAEIIEQRTLFIARINGQLNDVYNGIAHSRDTASIHYSHTLVGSVQQKLLDELHGSVDRDRHLGYTSVGPHRHDVVFKYNDNMALSVASRGEVRTIVLALKFIEVAIIKEITRQKPIILLDDVFSELDESRQVALMKYSKDHQMVIATTNSHSTTYADDITRVSLDGAD
ncbi:MAG: DNA replication and repair protein RecF [Candidatus Saccharimonadales bacterium]